MAALSDLAKYVRPEVSGCPEIQILDAILRAGKEFCKKTRAVKETISIVTVVDTPSYLIDTAAGTEPDEILSVSRSEFENLTPSSFKEFDDEGLNRSSGTPHYYYLSEGNKIVLGYIPNAVETLDITVKIRPSEDATTLPDELVNRYKEQIAAKAKSILMLMKNQAWTDLNQAAINEAIFNDAVADVNLREARGGTRKALRSKPSFF